MIIAIDYDNTFTLDPLMWEAFVVMARARGHECVLVTGRTDDGRLGEEVRRAIGTLMPVVFAGANWKRKAASDKGWKVDVWIDDNPEYVAEQSPIMRAAHGGRK